MNCSDCISRLDEYIDGELPAPEARAVETHLAGCASCRAQAERLRALLTRVAVLPREIAPPRDRWHQLRTEIRDLERNPPASAGFALLRWLSPLAVAAAVALLATLAERTHVASVPWSVAAVAGQPLINSQAFEKESHFRLGQVLETDAQSRARVTVGGIGEVTVDANSRLRLVGTAANNHRLDLQRGSMQATIWAPPKLFFVDTPSATAIDLGCQYTLNVDPDGNGELHVLLGYVALAAKGREAIVPMGLKCITRRQGGPGTPFAANASETFRTALLRFDFEPGAAPQVLPELLALARTDDSITLWHLLARTSGTDRVRVFETLAKLSPPPAGVTRDGIVAGNDTMRGAWGAELGIGSFAYQYNR